MARSSCRSCCITALGSPSFGGFLRSWRTHTRRGLRIAAKLMLPCICFSDSYSCSSIQRLIPSRTRCEMTGAVFQECGDHLHAMRRPSRP